LLSFSPLYRGRSKIQPIFTALPPWRLWVKTGRLTGKPLKKASIIYTLFEMACRNVMVGNFENFEFKR